MIDPIEVVSVQDHLVQLYEADEELLIRNVGRYLAEGFAWNQNGLVVAGVLHRDAFAAELESLGVDVERMIRDGRLAMLDARELLDRLLVRGVPDADRFSEHVAKPISELAASAPGGTCRVYGEMVGLLWLAGNVTAAIELEELWNQLLAAADTFSLYCGYPIDVFGSEFQSAVVDGVLCQHGVVVPAGSAALGRAIDRALAEVAGPNVVRLAFDNSRRPAMPKAEATALWVRANLPRDADAIMDRARLYYKR